MMTKQNLNTLLLIAVAVLVTLQISGMLRKSPVSEEAIRNEVRLEQLQKEYPAIKTELVEVREKYDSLLSASGQRVDKLEFKKQPIQNAIKNLRSTVADFDKEQLRRASSEYYRTYK